MGEVVVVVGEIELQMSGVAITSAEEEEGGGRTGRGDGRTRLKLYLLVKNERFYIKQCVY